MALSSNADHQDSPKSNTLVINSSKGSTHGNLSMEEYSSDDHDLPVKVTEVTETGIHLDWSAFVENNDVAFYKIQWSSVAQPAVSQLCVPPPPGGVFLGLSSCSVGFFPAMWVWGKRAAKVQHHPAFWGFSFFLFVFPYHWL